MMARRVEVFFGDGYRKVRDDINEYCEEFCCEPFSVNVYIERGRHIAVVILEERE